MEKFDLELELLSHIDAIDDLTAQIKDEKVKFKLLQITDYMWEKLKQIKGCEDETISR